MLPALYVLALFSLAIGTGGLWMAMSSVVPVRWLHRHYLWRKPVTWMALGAGVLWTGAGTGWSYPGRTLVPLVILALAVLLGHRLHQETAFPAVDFPPASDHPDALPIPKEASVAIIEYDGVTRAYPLDYVIHHHVVNDRFGDRIVSLTYCAMCRSIIPFDVTDIGPLFVGSFHDANMIVADRRTATFFQQATAESLVGKLHPHTLTPIPFQVLPWKEVLLLDPHPNVAIVTERDLREFQLPIPGIWKRIVASESTPGLSANRRDGRRPSRTRIVGVTDPSVEPVAYLKDDLTRNGVLHDRQRGVVLVPTGDTVNAYRDKTNGRAVNLELAGQVLRDTRTATTWDLRGTHLAGPLATNLDPVAISDEYWFSWRFFHPDVEVEHLPGR